MDRKTHSDRDRDRQLSNSHLGLERAFNLKTGSRGQHMHISGSNLV